MTEVKEAPRATEAGKGPGPAAEVEVRPTSAPVPWADPAAFMHRFAQEMDKLFEDFGFGRHLPRFLGRGRELLRREAGLIPGAWSPRVDVVQGDGAYVVRADLPGMTRDDITVEVTDEAVTIQGERKQEKKERRAGYSYSECAYGGFYRAVPLPEGADPTKATATFQNGVLEVTIPAPVRPEKKVRRVEIQHKA
jgi:HSP20 family protein